MRAKFFSAKIDGDDAIRILEDGFPGTAHITSTCFFPEFFLGLVWDVEKLSVCDFQGFKRGIWEIC